MKDKMLNKELICFLINIIKSLKQRMNLFEENNIAISNGEERLKRFKLEYRNF